MLLPTKKKKALDHTRHCCSHIQKRSKKRSKKKSKRSKHRLGSMQTQCTTVIPVFSQCCRKVTKTTNNVPCMHQHVPRCTNMHHAPPSYLFFANVWDTVNCSKESSNNVLFSDTCPVLHLRQTNISLTWFNNSACLRSVMAAAISVVVLVSTASSYLESELDQSIGL